MSDMWRTRLSTIQTPSRLSSWQGTHFMTDFQNTLLNDWAKTWNADERARFSAMSLRPDLSPVQLLDKISGIASCNFAIDRLVKLLDKELSVLHDLRNTIVTLARIDSSAVIMFFIGVSDVLADLTPLECISGQIKRYDKVLDPAKVDKLLNLPTIERYEVVVKAMKTYIDVLRNGEPFLPEDFDDTTCL